MKTILVALLVFGLTGAFAQKKAASESAPSPGKSTAETPVKPAKPAKQGGARPQTEEISFAVSGNCGMCKKRIENALYGVPGVKTAVWTPGNKQAKVVFQSGKTNLAALQAAVVKAGHDVETAKADEATYSKLPGCCKYREGNGNN